MSLRFPALCGRSALVCAIALTVPHAQADQFNYEPPANYYATATGTGATLKGQLYNIISVMTKRTYGDARYAFETLDRDPANANNILLIYNRASLDGTWNNSTLPFNREHIWPDSRLSVDNPGTDTKADSTDLFNLRPCVPTINTNRGNSFFGLGSSAPPTAGYGYVSGSYWHPGTADKGDVARTLFYMATRYGQGQTNNLSLGGSGTHDMGDLPTLLRWHYEDMPDTWERRRNEAIYNPALNPTYYQGNRNPYIDHPEYVWAVFGGAANNSRLAVGTPATDGSSTASVDLGSVIAGSSFGTQSVTLTKSGTHPTTFDASVTGSATSTLSGPRQSFGYTPATQNMTVGLNGSTSTVGLRSGTITFDNTDLTSAGTGFGSADGNDVVNVTGRVVSHAAPSLSLASTQLTQTIDFGIVAQDGSLPVGFSVFNRDLNGGFTAGLDLDAINVTGDAATFGLATTASSNLAAGSSRDFSGSLLTTALGSKSATYQLLTSDQNIPGATGLSTLTVTLSAQIAIAGDATLDGLVNFNDLLALARNYQAGVTTWQTGDFNRDSATDFNDLLALARHYGGGAAVGLDPAFASDFALAQSLVPEPATLSLLGLAFFGRRRRNEGSRFRRYGLSMT